VRWISLDLRAGIHAGEFELLTERGGEPRPSGLAMAIGARILGLASPGEVLVSDTVRQLLAGSGHAFEPRGSHQLKGVPGEWDVYSVAERD
jgi:class 3 adenylate cyclase